MQNLDRMLDDSVKELDGQAKQIKNKAFAINSSLDVLHNHATSKDEVYSHKQQYVLKLMSIDIAVELLFK